MQIVGWDRIWNLAGYPVHETETEIMVFILDGNSKIGAYVSRLYDLCKAFV